MIDPVIFIFHLCILGLPRGYPLYDFPEIFENFNFNLGSDSVLYPFS